MAEPSLIPSNPRFPLTLLLLVNSADATMTSVSHHPRSADGILPGSSDQDRAPIAATTGNCEASFSRCILRLESNGEEKTATELRRLEAKFLDWRGYLGVFARGSASLDHRLGRHAQQRDLVLLTLDMLDMSLAQMSTNPDDSESDESSDGEADRRKIELDGVRKSVNELSRLAIYIRLSPTSSLDARVQAFAARKAAEIAPFETLAMLAVKHLYPDSTDSTRRLLGKAMTDLYARLLYWKYHDRKLRLDRRREARVPAQREVFPQGPPAAPHQSRMPTKSEISSPSKPEESRVSLGTDLLSDTIPSNPASHVVIPFYESNVPIRRRAGASTVLGSKARFPKPPKLQGGESSLPCPLCRKIFPGTSFEDVVWWRQHVNDDLTPFVCLVELCSESCRYASRAEWKAHTTQHHDDFCSRNRVSRARDYMQESQDASGPGSIMSHDEASDSCPICCRPLTEPGSGPSQAVAAQKPPSHHRQELSASDLGTKNAKKSVRFDAAASHPATASEHLDEAPQRLADVAPSPTALTYKNSLLDHIAEHMQSLALLTVRLAVKRAATKSDCRSFSSAQEASSDGTHRHRSTLDTDLEFSHGDQSEDSLKYLGDLSSLPPSRPASPAESTLHDEIPLPESRLEMPPQQEIGKEDMILLLERRDQSEITPELVQEIAASYDEDVMIFLLEKLRGQIQITTDVVEAVARNQSSGKGVMALLLDSHRGQTMRALHLAAENGHEAAVRLCAEAGADHKKETPLHWAAKMGRKAVARLLVEAGANIEAKNHIQKTPLHHAAEAGHEAVAKLLVEAGANIKAKDYLENTPLHLVAQGGNETVARLLMEAGAQREARNVDGETPLHLAAEGGNEPVARLLMEAGAQREARNVDEETPLHFAAEGGNEPVARVLVEAGANMEAKDYRKNTPLHLAAEVGNEEVARLLVEAGADMEARDRQEHTPLHLAAKKGNETIARLLMEAGAYGKAKNIFGKTPLQLAAREGNEAIAELLKHGGGDAREEAAHQGLAGRADALHRPHGVLERAELGQHAQAPEAAREEGPAARVGAPEHAWAGGYEQPA
ncbi:hypothetical protein RB598_004872 [Gaeumannomyces tritici]